VAIFSIGIYVLARLSSSGKDIIERWGSWPAAVNETLQDTIACLRNKKVVISIATWGALAFALGALSNWICFASLGSYPGLARIVTYSFISGTFSFVTLTPGNIGIIEGAYGLISSGMKELAAAGIIVALMLRVAGFISLLSLAAVLGASDMIKRLRIRR
jgi:uncharacterized membrane protein YbhN (UPF0104 family)